MIPNCNTALADLCLLCNSLNQIVRTGPIDEQMMPKETGFINGGMFKRTGPVKSPVITLAVENLDTTFKEIEKAGGKVQRDNKGEAKMKVGDMGWVAYFQDTEGNIIGLWQNASKEQ